MNTESNHAGSAALDAEVERTRQLVAELNGSYHTNAETCRYMSLITGKPVADTVRVFAPIYINYGPGLSIGENCFFNFGCTLLALGGISIADGVFVGPNCTIASEFHPEEPTSRHSLLTAPISIGRNVWIGASATILAGVSIGENAIVAAGSVVNHDVPSNTIVAGVPARVVRSIKG